MTYFVKFVALRHAIQDLSARGCAGSLGFQGFCRDCKVVRRTLHVRVFVNDLVDIFVLGFRVDFG